MKTEKTVTYIFFQTTRDAKRRFLRAPSDAPTRRRSASAPRSLPRHIANKIQDSRDSRAPLPTRVASSSRPVVVGVSPRADFEASLKIDAQNATWLDTQRQSWIEDVRDLGARLPFAPTPMRAVHLAARFLGQLVASALPEAMKRAREGGWTARGLEQWRDRLSRVRLICEAQADESDRLEESRDPDGPRNAFVSESRAARDRAPTVRSTLATLEVSPPRRRERRAGDRPAARERTEAGDRLAFSRRRVAEALRAGAPGLASVDPRATVSPERLAALREDENYQALVNLYRDRMRRGTMPRSAVSGGERSEITRLERAREDPERDALIAATVNNMLRRSQASFPPRVDARFVENARRVWAEREREARDAEVAAPSSFSSPETDDEIGRRESDRDEDSPRTPRERLTPRGRLAPRTAGDEPRRGARAPRSLEDAERLRADIPGITFMRETVHETASLSDDGDVASDPDEDAPPQLRRRVVGEAPREGVRDAGAAPECPPADVEATASADIATVTCPATLREMLGEARRAAASSDAAAESARDDVTCQICYARRRDALVMPCCHLLYCYHCVARASEAAEARGQPDRCPCCRGPISGVLRCKLTE